MDQVTILPQVNLNTYLTKRRVETGSEDYTDEDEEESGILCM